MRSSEKLIGYATLGLVAVSGAALMAFAVGDAVTHEGKRPPAAEPTVAEAQQVAAPETASAPSVDPTPSEPAAEPVPVAAAAAPEAGIDLAAGQKVFGKCKACHDAKPDGRNKTGPNLWGIVGRAPHMAEGFKYSDAMLADDEAWTPERLDAYLADPKGTVPGNKMAFAGLKKETDRANLIAWLSQQSDTPVALADLGVAAAAAGAAATAVAVAADTPDAEEPAGPVYTDPPGRTAEQQAEVDARVAALTAEVEGMDYQRARFHPIHFAPAIGAASDEECLVCHQEIVTATPRAQSPAGLGADQTLAWYQTLATYDGAQSDFHYRHIGSDFARATMNLTCNFCHKGNDPREESPAMEPLHPIGEIPEVPAFTNRKMVNPETTCLRCHGAMPDPVEIMGLGGPWHEIRADMEDPADEDPTVANGCLSCHRDLFRTNRHAVTYLNAATIEDLAEAGSDTCYGCHGGRQWYRISYPYPRHAWPDMDPETPDWAADRPTESDPEYALPPAAAE